MILQEWLHAARLYLQISIEVAGATSHAFVDRCFWRIWRQEAEPELFARHTTALAQGRRTRFGVVRQMAAAPQHAEVVAHPRPYTLFETLYLLRCKLVRRLPAADVLVDLGGAAPASLQGALLVMGYRHRFQTLTIVDLPPPVRLGEYSQGAQERSDSWIETELGRVRYLHRSMSDLSVISDASAGLVFSGQSLADVSVAEGARVLQEAYRVLRRGGVLFLDTPNAAITRIVSPHAFIHPDHKVEYRVPELVAMVEAVGFTIEKQGGIGAMPRTLRTRVFDEREVVGSRGLSANPHHSFLFYIQARKP